MQNLQRVGAIAFWIMCVLIVVGGAAVVAGAL
jgi:hypothetical protein